MDRIQLRNRLNTSNGIPIIDKRMLRGGIKNINLRKEIKRYSDECKRFEEKTIIEKPTLKKMKIQDWGFD